MRTPRRAWPVAAILLLGIAPAQGGCSQCDDIDCGLFEGRIVEAELIDREGQQLELELEGGDRLTARVFGPANVLDEGRSYLFPLSEHRGNRSVELAQPCSCGGPFVQNLDGSNVDTGLLATAPLAVLTLLVSGCVLAIFFGRGALRFLRRRVRPPARP